MLKNANVGRLDRVIRIVAGLALVALPLVTTSSLWDSAVARWSVTLVGSVLIVTALVRFCPLYRLVGTSTCRTT